MKSETLLKVALALVLLPNLFACESVADGFCESEGCELTEREWETLSALAHLGTPEPDPANKYVGDERAEILGQMLYFDPRVSGVATQVDTQGQLIAQSARAPKGSPIDISCATCHDPARGGADHTSVPGHVSVGAGWYDVNAQPTVNSAFYDLKYWNGRYDSLVWQILAVAESGVSLNGNRVEIAWLLSDRYRAMFEEVFDEHPLPTFGRSRDEQVALLESDGQCRLDAGACPSNNDCHEENVDGETRCYPRFPLQGKPGKVEGCQRGDASEPFGDAFDCMSEADQETMTRAYVNYAKAISAYEYLLVSGEAPFDRFIDAGPDSDEISDEAKRGARLFVGKASCVECHNTALFSDEKFYNIGVPQVGLAVPTEATCTSDETCAALGWYVGLNKLKNGRTFRIDSPKYSDNPQDRSRQHYYDLELNESMRGAWRTPSLRDVERTAPYMHNGFYRSLEEVVRHYDEGGTPDGAAPDALSVRLEPLGLTEQEIQDLVAFLRTLTGDPLPDALVTAPELP